LESKLDVFSLAYIKHSVELEVFHFIFRIVSIFKNNSFSFREMKVIMRIILGGIGGGKEKRNLIKVFIIY